MLDSSELDLTGESREVIEAYRLFAQDQGWRQKLRDAVRTGLTAEAAVERVQDELRLRVTRMGDPFLRERLHDFEDLARRLQRHLTGDSGGTRSAAKCRAGRPRDGAGGTARLRPRPPHRAGAGRRRGHLACRHRRARDGVAAGRRMEGVVDTARAGDPIVVDGESGEAHLRPPPEIVSVFEARAPCAQRVARIAAVRDLPAVTKDGVPIR
jgi:phosphotransferase system enzyme I (PtsP)